MNKEELMILLTLQGTSHCSCLEHCFLFFQHSLFHLDASSLRPVLVRSGRRVRCEPELVAF